MTIAKPRTVAIIGAGFSGINAYVQVQKELGITPTVFESNLDIGGTWLTSTYPGCRCDVPSQLYSLSSELNPNWSQTYASQKEILEYLQAICRKHKIYENTRFGTEVEQASWVDGQWELKVKSHETKETLHFDLLFLGVGSLRIPHIPPEFKNFKGSVIHTGEWDSSLEFKDKRIGLVGSGSSAIQVFPFLAKEASCVVLYQRSVPWVFPQVQEKVSDLTKWIFSWLPLAITLYRWFLILYYERQYILLGYPNSKFANNTRQGVLKANQEYLKDVGRSDLMSSLQPTSLTGCRRIVQSDTFLQTVTRNNVTLVTEPIENIKNDTVFTKNTEHQLDVLVLGTGYETQEGVLGGLSVIGKEGQSLTQLWRSSAPELYKSTMIHGFPNLFMLLGPYTLTGHISVVLMAEIQVKYAIQCIKKIQDVIEPTKEAQSRYMQQLRSDFRDTAWVSSCSSWYKNQSGVITSLYPNTATRFRWELGQFNKCDYEVMTQRQ
ncbi:uncharacterized protein EV154DRAFT_494015 [Mucor mucedo]|uniref:uncharacterized protein n=1 Tax=Mucor mucedo TaxID=29922 RepID=UPI002220B190|nr:uncharacterized protein EV154DRAFT_494015 [Mucor mucedo]KAI7895866.1 hypothetical protein EV154DRAFT_494015 [Mucor mucedo]